MPEFDWTSPTAYDRIQDAEITGRGNACVATPCSSKTTEALRRRPCLLARSSVLVGGYVFAADPTKSFLEQTVIWAPEVLATVIPVRRAPPLASDTRVALELDTLTAGDLRRAPDGWHGVLQIRGVEHRIWLKEPPIVAATYAVELPLDADFEFRAHAARRFWRVLNGRLPGPAFHEISAQRRRRLAQTLRALDGRMAGNSYRVIAEVLFGASRIPEHAWKTHDLRNRTIRLVRTGFALMRGGYRDLLRPKRRNE
jgi:type VI secretion system activator RovC-like protein